MTPEERRQALESIAAEVRACTRCRLHVQRTRAVPGEGHADTEVVFVGEGPGFNEDREGRPFVGAAGNLLNALLKAIGWKREEVFITNVVKCRPPGNRDPEPDEIAACAPFLRRQLEVLDPAVIVTLGRHSLQTFMPGARIGAAHGTQRPADPATGAGNAMAYAMYHPAAALRQLSLKETMLLDMAGLPEALLRARQRRDSTTGSSDVPAGEPAESARSEAEAPIVPAAESPATDVAADPIPVAAEPDPAVAAAIPVAAEPIAVAAAVGTRLPAATATASPVDGDTTGRDVGQMELF